MSRICDICQKTYLKGNQVQRGVGRRVTRRSIIKQLPNLRSKKLVINGIPLRLLICTSCLKRSRFADKKEKEAEKALVQAQA